MAERIKAYSAFLLGVKYLCLRSLYFSLGTQYMPALPSGLSLRHTLPNHTESSNCVGFLVRLGICQSPEFPQSNSFPYFPPVVSYRFLLLFPYLDPLILFCCFKVCFSLHMYSAATNAGLRFQHQREVNFLMTCTEASKSTDTNTAF